MKTISSYEVLDKTVLIRTPYCGVVIDQCRKWGGKWDKTKSAWVVSATRLAAVQAVLGIAQDDLVEVEVRKTREPKTNLTYDERQETGCETLAEAAAKFPDRFGPAASGVTGLPGFDITDNIYHLGWYVLASRSGRDSAADLYADLADGEIPDSGGSTKHPTVSGNNCAFRLWVPRDFATARNLTVVTDPKAGRPEPAKKDDKIIARIKALMTEAGLTLDDLR